MERERRRRHRARLREHTKTLDAWGKDFVSFAAELDVIDKDGIRVRVRPTAMLSAFEAQRTGRDIVLKPRQVFFTTWELARDLLWLLTRNAAHVVVLAPSDSENYAIRELVQRVNVMLGFDSPGSGAGLVGRHPWLAPNQAAGRPPGNDPLRWEDGELRFGPARMEIKGAGATSAAAKKVGRSGTVQRLHITEISSFEFANDTWTAIEPTVPTGLVNEISIESTPQGAAGLFHKLYHDAKARKNSFTTFFFAWMRHQEYRARLEPGETVRATTPREKEMVRKYGASAQQVKWYRAKVADKGQSSADQEYPMDEETCWLIAGRLFFDAERTKLLMTETRDPVRIEVLQSSVPDPGMKHELLVWKEPYQRDEYVVIGDPSEGIVGGDPCAAAVYHRSSGEHVATLHGLWRTHEFAGHLDRLGRRYNNALMVIERVNHGHAVLNALLRLRVKEDGETEEQTNDEKRKAYPNVFHDADDKAGWKTGEIPRATAAEAFEAAYRTGAWHSPCRMSLVECQHFVVNKAGKPEAAAGANDDLVLVHVIGHSILSRPRAPRPRTGPSDSRYASDEGGRGFY